MLAPLPANTFHLHGRRDPLISFRSVSRLRKPESPGEGENHLTANHRPGEIARAILGAVGG